MKLLSRKSPSLGEQGSLPIGRSLSDARPGAVHPAAASVRTSTDVAPAVVDARFLAADKHPEVVLELPPGKERFLHPVKVVELTLRKLACLNPRVPRNLEPLLRNVVPSKKAQAFSRERDHSCESTR